ncbi:MAG: DUF1598 domain-containing protein [candidate division KSB1 bacterium]|nr:DUF1598 domain-containing protein [candidate division KSB1 bacterium]
MHAFGLLMVLLLAGNLVRSGSIGCNGRNPNLGPEITERGSATGLAISLKALQEQLRASAAPAAENLFGITKVIGAVADPVQHDLILLGIQDSTLPALYLDDFVVALRNARLVYAEREPGVIRYTPPSCSIDPQAETLANLEVVKRQINATMDTAEVESLLHTWNNTCSEQQSVRIWGVPRNCRFARVMVEADYFMKRVADGSASFSVQGFQSLSDMMADAATAAILSNQPVSVGSMNRFWFAAGEVRLAAEGNITTFSKCQVRLLTEQEYLAEGGETVGTGRADPLAQKFAQRFTEKYSEIAKEAPIYAEPQALFRLFALVKALEHRNLLTGSGCDLSYLIQEYPLKEVPVPETLPGISNVKKVRIERQISGGSLLILLWLPSCGGVSMDVSIGPATFPALSPADRQMLREMGKNVQQSRPSLDAAFWPFVIPISPDKFGQIPLRSESKLG